MQRRNDRSGAREQTHPLDPLIEGYGYLLLSAHASGHGATEYIPNPVANRNNL